MQAVQAAASKLLSPLLGSLISYYPLNQFDPLPKEAPQNGSDPPHGVGVEAWLSAKPQDSQIRQHKPTWHQPTAEETQFAEDLTRTFLTEAAQQLLGLSQGQGSGQSGGGPAPGASKYPKELMQGLLLQIEGSFVGLQSVLPDFPAPKQSSGEFFWNVHVNCGHLVR